MIGRGAAGPEHRQPRHPAPEVPEPSAQLVALDGIGSETRLSWLPVVAARTKNASAAATTAATRMRNLGVRAVRSCHIAPRTARAPRASR